MRELKEEKVRLAHLISKVGERFEERLSGNDLKLTLADDSRIVQAGLAQRYPDGAAVWLNTPSLETNFGPVSSAFWQQVHLDMANPMAEAGLAPYLQFGEVQWWYLATVWNGQAWQASSGTPLYDDYTKSTFQAIYGGPVGLITSQNAPPASFLQQCPFLPTLIGQFTDSIINFVCQTQPSTRFEGSIRRM